MEEVEPETLKDAIIKSFQGFPLSEELGKIIWAALANNDLYPKAEYNDFLAGKISKEKLSSFSYSGSFRYNGAQIANALNEVLGTRFTYTTFYCQSASKEDCDITMTAFTNNGYVWVINAESPQYIRDLMDTSGFTDFT